MNIERKWKIGRLFITFVYLIVGWLLFTWNVHYPSLLTGAMLAFLVAYISYDYFIDRQEIFVRDLFPRVDLMVLYLIVLLIKVYFASFDVVYRVLTMKINPAEVRLRTRLRSDLSRALLANAITLTPGTVTVDVQEDYLYVHWLTAKTTNALWAAQLIKGQSERWLGRILR